MPKLTIFDDGNKVDELYFEGHFYIEVSEDDELVFWRHDNQQNWSQSPKQVKSYNEALKPVTHIWIPGSVTSNSYTIQFVRPDWHLYIHDQKLPVGLYAHLTIQWTSISLEYHSLIFQFDFSDLNSVAEPSFLPTPISQ